ncbi:MAG: hypothetical protein EHM58_16700 [Ignavibacteriae bacterium]|nr:MAG: hypothetical protein EHM58_16700 [Ignavibacteriota bacterium]
MKFTKEVSVEIDRLINSIRNVISGDIFDTEVVKISTKDIGKLKSGWNFDWIKESKSGSVYKLTIKNNPDVIQGLISLYDNVDHIFIDLIESAAFNIGKNKVYEGVAGNLFAFACKLSFEKGYDGFTSFIAKTNLIPHYIKLLNARRISNTQILVIDNIAARNLIKKYFEN